MIEFTHCCTISATRARMRFGWGHDDQPPPIRFQGRTDTMKPKIIGHIPWPRTNRAGSAPRIGTIFPGDNAVVTLPGMIHYFQREAYLDLLAAERQQRGQPPLGRRAEHGNGEGR